MEAVRRGGNRQALHEVIRRGSMETTRKMKDGEPCDLAKRLSEAEVFGMTEEEIRGIWQPEKYIGRCVEQVDAFLKDYRAAYGELTVRDREIDV